ncbi:MAG: hypothetical protein H0X52_00440 [Gemmatimonadetes bacterium]|nr:hypothetical protein [Gemmatimonadota bacterium]
MRLEARQVDALGCALSKLAQPIHTTGQNCRDGAQCEHPSHERVTTEIGSAQRDENLLGRRLDLEMVALTDFPSRHEIVDQHG